MASLKFGIGKQPARTCIGWGSSAWGFRTWGSSPPKASMHWTRRGSNTTLMLHLEKGLRKSKLWTGTTSLNSSARPSRPQKNRDESKSNRNRGRENSLQRSKENNKSRQKSRGKKNDRLPWRKNRINRNNRLGGKPFRSSSTNWWSQPKQLKLRLKKHYKTKRNSVFRKRTTVLRQDFRTHWIIMFRHRTSLNNWREIQWHNVWRVSSTGKSLPWKKESKRSKRVKRTNWTWSINQEYQYSRAAKWA